MRPCVKARMDIQYVKVSKTLLTSARQQLWLNFWSLWKKFVSRNSVSSIWILRLFVNILTLVDKYSLSVKVSVQRNQFSAIISVTQNIFLTFFSIPEIYIKFSIFLKNTQVTQQMYFGNGRLQKEWLRKWLKIQVSEYLWTGDMLKGLNHHSYLHGSSFAIFFYHSEGSLVRKILS